MFGYSPNSLSRGEIKKIIRSFMIWTKKYDWGSEQDAGHVYMDVPSPIVSSAAVYTVCPIAVVEIGGACSVS